MPECLSPIPITHVLYLSAQLEPLADGREIEALGVGPLQLAVTDPRAVVWGCPTALATSAFLCLALVALSVAIVVRASISGLATRVVFLGLGPPQPDTSMRNGVTWSAYMSCG